MTETADSSVTSDADLVERTRHGDRRAFGDLWSRHHAAGIRVARHATTLDADDVVSESFTRIYRAIRAGGGPTGAFRPYLYATIRNISASWGSAAHDIPVEDIAEYAPAEQTDDPASLALDRTLTAKAFRSLPERWQTVLWYTEVEGMDPHEVAPILGITANSVAALSYRAREGLRKAWLQAHISDATAHGECKWALSRLGDRARNSLPARDAERMDFHLATCAHCAIVSEELEEVGSRLAAVLLPIVLGGGVGGLLLAAASTAGAPGASAAAAAPFIDVAGAAAGGAASAATAGVTVTGTTAVAGTSAAVGAITTAGALTGPLAVVGSLTLAFALAGTAIVVTPPTTPDIVAEQISSTTDPSHGVGGLGGTEEGTAGSSGDSAVPDPGAVAGGLGAGGLGSLPGAIVDEVDDLTDAVVDTLTGESTPPPGHTAPGGLVGADFDLTLTGTATPGAHLSLQAAGQIYATTTVAADGTFVIAATAIPGGLSQLELVQYVDRSYLATLLPGGGVLEKVLGTLDTLVNALIRPIQLGSGDSRVTITLLS